MINFCKVIIVTKFSQCDYRFHKDLQDTSKLRSVWLWYNCHQIVSSRTIHSLVHFEVHQIQKKTYSINESMTLKYTIYNKFPIECFSPSNLKVGFTAWEIKTNGSGLLYSIISLHNTLTSQLVMSYSWGFFNPLFCSYCLYLCYFTFCLLNNRVRQA